MTYFFIWLIGFVVSVFVIPFFDLLAGEKDKHDWTFISSLFWPCTFIVFILFGMAELISLLSKKIEKKGETFRAKIEAPRAPKINKRNVPKEIGNLSIMED